MEKTGKKVIKCIVKCHTTEVIISLAAGYFMGSYMELKKSLKNKEAN